MLLPHKYVKLGNSKFRVSSLFTGMRKIQSMLISRSGSFAQKSEPYIENLSPRQRICISLLSTLKQQFGFRLFSTYYEITYLNLF